MNSQKILFPGFSTPLQDIVVLEWGNRTAIRACGDLMSQLGAKVIASVAQGGTEASFSRFKHLLSSPDPAERHDALARANVVLISSDREDELPLPQERPDLIICDITVGRGKHPGNWTDPLLQAYTGIANITGEQSGPPSICGAPVIELQAATFAAAGILAAWRQRVENGLGQRIGISLIDCGLNGLSSFLPFVFAGQSIKRSGNSHPMAVPWNSYRAKDGWILLCSATDNHWVRLCDVMGRHDLREGDFATLAGRIENRHRVDAIVQEWSQTLSVKVCIEVLNAVGLAAGPILAIDELKGEPNLRHRNSISDDNNPLPRSFLKCAFPATATARPSEVRSDGTHSVGTPPLAGMRVVEIGQYTTAPLAAKQLALLGAEVLKIESPGGEASRAWPPHQGGQSYFYTMNNANKRSCVLDLRTDSGRETFTRLVQGADVLIENLKPGSLDRLGFGAGILKSLNSRLVYCAISGFGQVSAYPGRAAFDTVVQAMSGLMDVTKVNGVPTKLGISVADIAGGIAGLLAVLAGLEQRRRTGEGTMIDLAMQDVAVWMTQASWHGAPPLVWAVLGCEDGYIVAACPDSEALAICGDIGKIQCSDAIARITQQGIAAAQIRTLEQIAEGTAILGDSAISMVNGADGYSWPLFNPPYEFSSFKAIPLVPIGALGEANNEIEHCMQMQ